jgi:tRNA(Ile)-lysidine synthase
MKEFTIYQKVHAYIEEMQMLPRDCTVLMGVSGGADSLAMADILSRMAAEKSVKLLAVHVNHGIRGEEALRDQQASGEFCRKRGIPYRIFSYDVPAFSAEKHMGIEEAGRFCRREAFTLLKKELKKQNPCADIRIALAHTQNDQAETVLHNLARGSGLRGLAGILPVSEDRIRPVLCLKRGEIEEYCRERQISYMTDSTNLEDHYTRNRIRHHVLPMFEAEINAEAVAHIAQASAQIAQADAYLSSQAEKLLDAQEKICGGYLFSGSFMQENVVLKSYAIMEGMKRLSGKQKDFTALHIRDILSLMEKEVGKCISLPCRLEAVRTCEGLALQIKKPQEKPCCGKRFFQNSADDNLPEDSEEAGESAWPVRPGECLVCPFGVFQTEIFPYTGQKIEEKTYTKWFDYDKIKRSMTVRTRRSGDFLVIDREGRHKSLKRYFIDRKVPAEERGSIPLLACEAEILWIVGGRISEKYKITEDTRTVFQIIYERGE